jgi:hypothetical protein
MIRRTKETRRIDITTPADDSPATIILEERVFRLDSGIGRMVWSRPAAIIQESAGRTMAWPIRDMTRRGQLAGIILALIVFLIGLRFK